MDKRFTWNCSEGLAAWKRMQTEAEVEWRRTILGAPIDPVVDTIDIPCEVIDPKELSDGEEK